MVNGQEQPIRGRLSARAQPGERVTEFLFAEFARPDIRPGVRLPSIRELAAQLSVSAPTVQQVFSKLTRQGLIRTEVGKGSFLVSLPERVRAEELTIALSVRPPVKTSAADWGHSIGQGIWEAAIHAPRRLNLTPLSESEDPAEFMEELREACDRVDALVLLPIWGGMADGVIEFYESRGKPVVHINPPTEHATENFVSADYFEAGRRLGKVWREAGRRDVVYIGQDTTSRSISTHLRCLGLMSGLQVGLDSSIRFRHCCSVSTAVRNGYEVMREFIGSPSELPDAVFCSGDYLAAGTIEALLEQGVSVPDQVSVVGGTGLAVTQSPIPGLTRTMTPFSQIGAMAIAMVGRRCDQSGEAAPGRYLPLSFAGGATTTAEENAMLISSTNNQQETQEKRGAPQGASRTSLHQGADPGNKRKGTRP